MGRRGWSCYNGSIMAATLVKTRHAGFAVEHVAGWKWDRDRLYVYLVGGRFIEFRGTDAANVYDVLGRGAIDLESDYREEVASGAFRRG